MKPSGALEHLLGVILLLGGMGCSSSSTGTDAPPTGEGLTIQWRSRPEQIPDDSSSIRLESARFRLTTMRVVGDAGPLQLAPTVDLEWRAGIVPVDLVVADAPSGLYSRCIFDVTAMDGDYAYVLSGLVEIDDEQRPFLIRERGSHPISFDYSLTLSPGNGAAFPIRVEINKLVEAVDFRLVPFQNGRYLVDETSPQLAAVRDELARAFSSDL